LKRWSQQRWYSTLKISRSLIINHKTGSTPGMGFKIMSQMRMRNWTAKMESSRSHSRSKMMTMMMMKRRKMIGTQMLLSSSNDCAELVTAWAVRIHSVLIMINLHKYIKFISQFLLI
jgi:hypothetical protein